MASGPTPDRQQEAQRQARDNWFDSLPVDEVKDLAIARLCDAEEALTQTPIDGTLASHGWNESFARSMCAECARLRTHVESGTYDPAWGGSGLGRSLLDRGSRRWRKMRTIVSRCRYRGSRGSTRIESSTSRQPTVRRPTVPAYGGRGSFRPSSTLRR